MSYASCVREAAVGQLSLANETACLHHKQGYMGNLLSAWL